MNIQELNKMPKTMSSKGEAVTTFMGILGSSKESLRRIIVRGEFNEYPDDFHMHCTARNILEEAKGIWLPNYLSPVAFLTLLQKKIKGISWIPLAFVDNVWNYIEGVVISVLMQRCESYHRLQLSTRRICQNLISRMRERSVNWVNEILEMEKSTDYTCNPEYLTEWNIEITGFGVVTVGDAVKKSLVVDQAFDLRMRIVTYWKIVIRRVVDSMALHIQLCVRNLVENELEKEMVNELMGSSHGGHAIEKVLEESPLLAAKREKLKGSIELLRDSKEVLATIMDRIASAQII
ncbi:Dynamin-related protein 4C [Linum grandiflorum]